MKTQTKTRSCTEKRRYTSEDAAKAAVWRFIRQGASRDSMHAYSCGFCSGWHIGHRRKRAR